jgi:very-short-patch-repair endonuclease
MTFLYIGVVIILVVGIVAFFLQGGFEGSDDKLKYRYNRRNFFLTRAERECYDALCEAVGTEYRIFAQVHLPTLLDHTVRGQNWRAALAHINRKSVDFVLCDKAYLSPKLAIELDDKSHERPDRQERDREVERILKEAGVPLLRIENRGTFNAADLAQRIKEVLSQSTNSNGDSRRSTFTAASIS